VRALSLASLPISLARSCRVGRTLSAEGPGGGRRREREPAAGAQSAAKGYLAINRGVGITLDTPLPTM
jgi:hypothetical protein